ncbi:hypothetical protein [Liquorilactobacillus sicerae]|uniref:hypothetical protein n=1 Tax=Liquorilactobacillus sicerae TaxID=1416943 RepID=UPI00248177BB|nr:hypothetical protein [Liquorilactobacillus sicerae]
MKINEFEKLLKNFYELLLKEKNCLINNQPGELLNIVDKKKGYLEPFQNFHDKPTETVKVLVGQIQRQQRENLLLTKQAIGFEEMLLKAIRSNLKGSPVYSQSSHQKITEQQTSLIDWQA